MALRIPETGGAPCPRHPTAPPFRRRARAPAWIACAIATACASAPPPPPAPGAVRGRLAASAGGAASEPMVVFLESLDAPDAPGGPKRHPVLRLGERGLSPAVVAVESGDSIRLENATGIYHRLFSTSESNPFDLGVLRRGEARAVDLAEPGVVRIYCSLHPSERAVVFVAPSPHFATLRPPGGYEIRDVPAGRYRLHAWSESAPAPSRTVEVPPGASVAAEIAPPAAPE